MVGIFQPPKQIDCKHVFKIVAAYQTSWAIP
jgi:hypothetical protein